MKRFLVMFMTVGLTTGAVATAEAQQPFEVTERTVEVTYYGPWLPFGTSASICTPSGVGGCVTIPTDGNEVSMSATVSDASGKPVCVWVGAGSTHYGTFCGQTDRRISFDPGTDLELWIGLWYPASPDLATTGTLRVTIFGWTAQDPPPVTPAESPAPQSSPSAEPKTEPTRVERSVELALRGHLRGVGNVVSPDAMCRSEVEVVLQRKSSVGWTDVGSITSADDGNFALELRDRPGLYRATVAETGDSSERTCVGTVSAPARHRH